MNKEKILQIIFTIGMIVIFWTFNHKSEEYFRDKREQKATVLQSNRKPEGSSVGINTNTPTSRAWLEQYKMRRKEKVREKEKSSKDDKREQKAAVLQSNRKPELEQYKMRRKEKVREKEKLSKNTQNKYLLSCAWCGNSFDGRYGWARYMGIIQQCDMNVNPKNWAYMTECSKRCATEHTRSIRGY